MLRPGFLLAVLVAAALSATAQSGFINFETPQVHPLDLSPDGALLAACNTADNRVEIFDVSGATPEPLASIPVGLEPVTARFRTSVELWVVNQISDSVSVVDLTSGNVAATVRTLDEPADVVFAGNPARAFVSCSQVNMVQVFDPANLSAAGTAVAINGEDPRALAVSADGSKVYAAVYESGNGTTILGGGSAGGGTISFPPNVVDDANTPHGVMNPPFNAASAFEPAKNPGNGTPPKVGLIVRQDENGVWRDDTGADWTAFVSGANAGQSGRPVGWTLIDHDVAMIDANSLSVSYIDRLMNINMALAVNPASGDIAVVGTEAINEVRFEPMVNGIFVRTHLALADPATADASIFDLNPHLDYSVSQLPQTERDKSLGDPRGIVWNGDGTKAYITGMGSNNVVVVDASGARAGLSETIDVGAGPTGIALSATGSTAYVLNRFEGTISAIDLSTETESARVAFYDPTPEFVQVGRRHLFDTHATSGLGQVSCASCHVDARMDRLSWDLGDPSGTIKSLANLNLGGDIPGLDGSLGSFDPFHPMKGPMSTQTLQDIIGHEPFHWRGDRLGLEEFNPAYTGLLGDDQQLSPQEMQEFKDYLETLYFPPNPFRNLDNTLPTNLPLDGHYTTGRFGAAGLPLPNGNAARGLDLYRDQTRRLDQGVAACVSCHALPAGNGTDTRWNGSVMEPIPPDPVTGNHHTMLVSIDGSTNGTLKVAQLRNLYDKVGFSMVLT
ncbi:MAG: hypothetical protein IT368_05085, partial [Candidatus Hydrogenedentes bacterium]|nr:hypothetical protein [Candidatus Hydrogenedentota bacterium]